MIYIINTEENSVFCYCEVPLLLMYCFTVNKTRIYVVLKHEKLLVFHLNCHYQQVPFTISEEHIFKSPCVFLLCSC